MAGRAPATFTIVIPLKSLDDCVCAAPAWAGCWCARQALKCAAVAVRLMGRSEDEPGLRDTVLLTAVGDDPGPAGRVLFACKRVSTQNPAFSSKAVAELADLSGLAGGDRLTEARRPHRRRAAIRSPSTVGRIHPAATMGRGIVLDHGSGLVIGETAVVEDDVSILQNITLGGTGEETGDRHPKVRRGVLIGAGANILGNIEAGIGAKIGAGSVVVGPVAPYTSVVGVPARPVGKPHTALLGMTMDRTLSEPEYII